MKINWKDLNTMYTLGLLALILVSFASFFISNPAVPIIATMVFFIAPGFYYFYRNRHGAVDAAQISALFGFTMMPVYFLLLMVANAFLFVMNFSSMPDLMALGFGTNWAEVILELAVSGVLLTMPTFVSWFMSDVFVHKSRDKGV